MTRLFQNDFKNPVSPYGWSGVNVSAGCALTVNGERTHHGLYNLYATVGAGLAAGRHATVYYGSLGGSFHDHRFCRAMKIIIDQLPPAASGREPVFWFNDAVGVNSVCQYGFMNNAGTLQFLIRYRHAGAFYNALGSVASLNTPYCLEAEILQSTTGLSDGLARLFVNGRLDIEVLNIDNDDKAINYVTFGLVAVDPNAVNDMHMWGDCFVLADAYIGVEPELTAQII